MDRAQIIKSAVGRFLTFLGVVCLSALPALADDRSTYAYQQPASNFLRWVWIVSVFIVVWVFLYKMIYPFLLRHYRADASKALFWTLFWLYSVTWLQVILYIFFDYGFHYVWIGAVALFLSVLFLIAFLVTLLRQPG